jgi:hypothetical protein
MRKIRIILLLAALQMLVSCTERIDIKLDSSYVRLVVDGSITTDPVRQKVVLTETTSYYYSQTAPPVTGATVQISDGSSVYELREDSSGIYRTEYPVAGVPGNTYSLNIHLASPLGGFSDYSAISTLYPVNNLDSLQLDFHRDWGDEGIWEVKCYIQDPPTNDYYRFLVYYENRIVTDSLSEWFVTDDRFFNGNYAYGAPVAYLKQDKSTETLKHGDIVTVEVNSIGEGYANFIWDAQAEISGSNPLFSGPSANVKGNVSNGAIGYFAAYSITRASTVVADSIDLN